MMSEMRRTDYSGHPMDIVAFGSPEAIAIMYKIFVGDFPGIEGCGPRC